MKQFAAGSILLSGKTGNGGLSVGIFCASCGTIGTTTQNLGIVCICDTAVWFEFLSYRFETENRDPQLFFLQTRLQPVDPNGHEKSRTEV
jgi:hypothetical protein